MDGTTLEKSTCLINKKKKKKKWSEVIHETQSAHISQKQDGINAICNHKNNVPSRLSPHWVCSNSCTWSHDV